MSKFNSYNNNYWACDFETTTNNTKFFHDTKSTRVWLAYAKKFHPNGEEQINDEILTVTIEEFFDEFWNRKESATLFFHNLNWDGEFIKWYLVNNGFKYIFEETRKAQKGFRIFEDEKNIYFINVWKTVRTHNKTNKLVQLYIRCSLKLLTLSIENLAKVFNTTHKMEIEYDVEPFNSIQEVKQEFIDYIKIDVQTMIQPLIQFNQLFSYQRGRKTIGGLSKLTIGSTSLSIFKSFCYANKIGFKKNFYINYEDAYYLKNFYSGGLTSYNPSYQYKITNKINGRVYDVNSMYPSVMVENKFPIGNPVYNVKPDESYDIEMLQIYIVKAELKKDYYPPLLKPWRSATMKYEAGVKYVKRTEHAIAYYFKEELESLKRFYNIEYKVVKRVYFKSAYYFKDFINIYYQQRLKYKQEKDPREQMMKIFLNNSYGKFGQDVTKPTVVYCQTPLDRGDLFVKYKNKNLIVKTIRESDSSIGEYGCYMCEYEEKPEKVINVAIAACVTMHARIKLHDAIYANAENFLYCDTDSVFLKDFSKGIVVDENKLGAWKEEVVFDGIELGGSKLYILYLKNVSVKSAHAGINKKWAQDNLKPNDIITINKVLEAGSKKQTKKITGGMILVDTTVTIKERRIC